MHIQDHARNFKVQIFNKSPIMQINKNIIRIGLKIKYNSLFFFIVIITTINLELQDVTFGNFLDFYISIIINIIKYKWFEPI